MAASTGLSLRGFDPRPRAGGDRTLSDWLSRGSPFRSAPPRRGRQHQRCRCPPIRSFDPRPRAGGDQLDDLGGPAVSCFDPRPRAGGDHRGCARHPRRRGFDPRPRAGGDRPSRPPADRGSARVSIRAPPRRGRQPGKAGPRWIRRFDPRPRAGGDRCRKGGAHQNQRFRSAPPRRGRRDESVRGPAGLMSVSIRAPPPREGDFNPRIVSET